MLRKLHTNPSNFFGGSTQKLYYMAMFLYIGYGQGNKLSDARNRKWVLFPFKMPRRYQICIPKCLFYHRDDLVQKLVKITPQVCKTSTSG